MKEKIAFIFIAILFFALVIGIMNLISVKTNATIVIRCHIAWDPIENKWECVGEGTNCICILEEEQMRW